MKFGLDVANIGSDLSDPHKLIELAIESEKAGWDGFFLWNTFLNPDSLYIANPIVTMSAIATKTNRIKLGFLISPLPFYKPWQFASEIATLDHLSNGRFILGVGLGFNPKDFSSFNESDELKIRGEKLNESLDIITGLWTGKPFSYTGKHYQIKNVQLLPTCKQQPRVPIWVAGFWPNKKPFQRAAKYEGMYPGSDGPQLTPETIIEILKYIHSHRTVKGSFDALIWVKLQEKEEEIQKMVQEYEQAGLTWMKIPITPSKSYLELMEIIKAGPPINGN